MTLGPGRWGRLNRRGDMSSNITIWHRPTSSGSSGALAPAGRHKSSHSACARWTMGSLSRGGERRRLSGGSNVIAPLPGVSPACWPASRVSPATVAASFLESVFMSWRHYKRRCRRRGCRTTALPSGRWPSGGRGCMVQGGAPDTRMILVLPVYCYSLLLLSSAVHCCYCLLQSLIAIADCFHLLSVPIAMLAHLDAAMTTNGPEPRAWRCPGALDTIVVLVNATWKCPGTLDQPLCI